MCQSSDIFELIIQLTFWFVDYTPEKYLTLELNMIVGNVVKTISFIIIVFALDILDGLVLFVYSSVWLAQLIFMKSESVYIFDGTSNTKKREFRYKLLNVIQDYLQVVFLFSLKKPTEFLKIFQERDPSFTGIYIMILLILLCLDFFELIILCFIDKYCQRQNFIYEEPGEGQYFLIFRLIGGIIGIVIMLIFYFIFKDQKEFKNSVYVYYFLPIHMGVESIILITSTYQLCRKRANKRVVVSDKVATKKQLRIKKWYCIFLGFTYGLFEVPVAIEIVFFEVFGYLFNCCQVPFCGKFLCAGEIIEYEIVDEREEQIMIQI